MECHVDRDNPYRDLALEYFERCEVYDGRVCSGKYGGIAVPAGHEESALVNRNAQDVIKSICHRTGILRADLVKAIQKVASENYREEMENGR
jgi:hypothetical protein